MIIYPIFFESPPDNVVVKLLPNAYVLAEIGADTADTAKRSTGGTRSALAVLSKHFKGKRAHTRTAGGRFNEPGKLRFGSVCVVKLARFWFWVW